MKKHTVEPGSPDLKSRGNQWNGCRASPAVQVCGPVLSLIPILGLTTSEVLLGDTRSLSYSWEKNSLICSEILDLTGGFCVTLDQRL